MKITFLAIDDEGDTWFVLTRNTFPIAMSDVKKVHFVLCVLFLSRFILDSENVSIEMEMSCLFPPTA